MTPSVPLEVGGRFVGTCHLQLLSRRISRVRNQRGNSLRGSQPEDGGEVLFRKVGFLRTTRPYILFVLERSR
jgi:hypothetical protein